MTPLTSRVALVEQARRSSPIRVAVVDGAQAVVLDTHPKLLGITDATINIAPDLNAKAEILRNAIELFHLLGVEQPKVAVLSAVDRSIRRSSRPLMPPVSP